MSEQSLAKIQRGTISEVILDRLKPEIDSQALIVISDLKQSFRAGTLTHEMSIALIAKLVAFEDLEMGLKQKIKIGNKIREEEL